MKNHFRLLIILLASLLLTACQATPQPPPTSFPQAPTETILPLATSTPLATPTVAYTFPPIRTPQARPALTEEGVVNFRILHINDFHAELIENTLEYIWAPGVSRLVTVVKEERAKVGPNQSLLLDAGDWLEGSFPDFDIQPLDVIKVFHDLGMDATVVGNHEIFLGLDVFLQVLQASPPLEILSANFRTRDAENHCLTDQPVTNPYKIYELTDDAGGTVRVAVIGMTMRDVQFKAPNLLKGACSADPKEVLLELYDQIMQQEKPDLMVLLTHIGISGDKSLATYLNSQGKPVDLIIGGHSHSWIDEPAVVGNTLIVHAGERGRALGILDLAYDRASDSLSAEWQLRGIDGCVTEDPQMLAFLKSKYAEVYARDQFSFLTSRSISVVFDGKSEPNGLWTREESGDDGTTLMTEKEGVSAITNAEGSNYLYFDLMSTFYGCPQPVEVTVEYFDEGYGGINIEIDKGGVGPTHPCELCYHPMFLASLNNTKTWKTATITLTDATFTSNQKWGTDFRLSGYGTLIFIRSVTITKTAMPTP